MLERHIFTRFYIQGIRRKFAGLASTDMAARPALYKK